MPDNILKLTAKLTGLTAATAQTDSQLNGLTIATVTVTTSAPGFAPIFPDICYHLTHYRPAAADIPVASDNPA
ncbi:hypothetical protein J2T26_004389, partial [Citrobacter farmeri]|uniref:hypothetical protein n=1 Tax=Citrobacter farmeri TaxID=67824 RepID=UPI00209DAC66